MQYNNGQNQKFFTDLRGEIVFITGAPYKNTRDLSCSAIRREKYNKYNKMIINLKLCFSKHSIKLHYRIR